MRAAFVLALMLLPRFALAQGSDDNRKFFEKDFAKGPFNAEATKTPAPRKTPSSAADSVARAVSSPHQSPSGYEPPDSDVQSTGTIFEVARAVKVKSIGMILNFADIEHGRQKLEETYDVAKRYNIPLGKFYVLLDANNYMETNRDTMALLARGADVKFKDRLPNRYKKVRLSPTWLIQTEVGEYILEAPPSLGRFFNGKGEFLEPRVEQSDDDLSEEAVDTPSPSASPSASSTPRPPPSARPSVQPSLKPASQPSLSPSVSPTKEAPLTERF